MKKLNIKWLSNCPKCKCKTAIVTTKQGHNKKPYEGDAVSCKECDAIGEIECDDGIAWCVWHHQAS